MQTSSLPLLPRVLDAILSPPSLRLQFDLLHLIALDLLRLRHLKAQPTVLILLPLFQLIPRPQPLPSSRRASAPLRMVGLPLLLALMQPLHLLHLIIPQMDG